GSIKGIASLAPLPDESGVLERGKVLGNRGLGDIEPGLELRHVHLALTQALKHRTPRGIGECAKYLRLGHSDIISVHLWVCNCICRGPERHRLTRPAYRLCS